MSLLLFRDLFTRHGSGVQTWPARLTARGRACQSFSIVADDVAAHSQHSTVQILCRQNLATADVGRRVYWEVFQVSELKTYDKQICQHRRVGLGEETPHGKLQTEELFDITWQEKAKIVFSPSLSLIKFWFYPLLKLSYWLWARENTSDQSGRKTKKMRERDRQKKKTWVNDIVKRRTIIKKNTRTGRQNMKKKESEREDRVQITWLLLLFPSLNFTPSNKCGFINYS